MTNEPADQQGERTNVLYWEERQLFDAIKHGDEQHQAWLSEAIAAWNRGKPVPSPRGLNDKDARITALETENAELREALSLAADRLEICHGRMMGCNVQDVHLGNPPVHELVGDVVEWIDAARVILQEAP